MKSLLTMMALVAVGYAQPSALLAQGSPLPVDGESPPAGSEGTTLRSLGCWPCRNLSHGPGWAQECVQMDLMMKSCAPMALTFPAAMGIHA
jgi:hypothetical protein